MRVLTRRGELYATFYIVQHEQCYSWGTIMPSLMWRELAGRSWRMKELNGPHARQTEIQ